MTRIQAIRMAAAVAVGLAATMGPAAPAGAAERSLRHAVTCPPFKGDSELAARYHEAMLDMLRESPGVEYIDPAGFLSRRPPEFSYRVNGSVQVDEDGQAFVMVSLVDSARKEPMASHVSPASTDPEVIGAWKRMIQANIKQRVSRLPFEYRMRRQRGQNSYTLDRGLNAGLVPGMILHVSRDDVVLLSPMTGEMVGRETLRPVGQVEIFRVLDDTAYARPVAGSRPLPSGRLYAWTF